MAGRIWLIGGTQESAQIGRSLAQQSVPCTVTVTTPEARRLYPDCDCLRIWVGRLDGEQITPFLIQEQIEAILDASHPFAVEVSRLAMAIATRHHIPYLRYERPTLAVPSSCDQPSLDAEVTLPLNALDTLLTDPSYRHQRVLLTLGYRLLDRFRDWHTQMTLFARILPSPVALEAAIAAGFTSDRLIALRPPLSADLERALWQHWQISTVITKASGTPGGEDVKRQIAQSLGVRLVTLARPPITYLAQTSNLQGAIAFCRAPHPIPAQATP
ncbi:MAG: cobalt-precorrin-6A reductase [Synechococcales bacterium]|nr:cobalt-precorrin-6A reductase [Synechococcales bacterium]